MVLKKNQFLALHKGDDGKPYLEVHRIVKRIGRDAVIIDIGSYNALWCDYAVIDLNAKTGWPAFFGGSIKNCVDKYRFVQEEIADTIKENYDYYKERFIKPYAELKAKWMEEK